MRKGKDLSKRLRELRNIKLLKRCDELDDFIYKLNCVGTIAQNLNKWYH